MKIRLRLPRRLPGLRSVDTGGRHWFSQTFDPGRAAIAPGGGFGPGYGTIGSVTVADTDARRGRCNVPGCGRDQHDPIHRDGSD
jgi:hypothetical protein